MCPYKMTPEEEARADSAIYGASAALADTPLGPAAAVLVSVYEVQKYLGLMSPAGGKDTRIFHSLSGMGVRLDRWVLDGRTWHYLTHSTPGSDGQPIAMCLMDLGYVYSGASDGPTQMRLAMDIYNAQSEQFKADLPWDPASYETAWRRLASNYPLIMPSNAVAKARALGLKTTPANVVTRSAKSKVAAWLKKTFGGIATPAPSVLARGSIATSPKAPPAGNAKAEPGQRATYEHPDALDLKKAGSQIGIAIGAAAVLAFLLLRR